MAPASPIGEAGRCERDELGATGAAQRARGAAFRAMLAEMRGALNSK